MKKCYKNKDIGISKCTKNGPCTKKVTHLEAFRQLRSLMSLQLYTDINNNTNSSPVD